MKVAVVTVNYNTAEDTNNLLESLRDITIKNFLIEIIVVDNGSKEHFTFNKKLDKYGLTIMRSEENNGFAGGYNLGIKKALENGADYILIINNDTIIDKDLIVNLLKVLQSKDKVAITVPKIYFAKGHEFHKEKYSKDELGKVLWFAGGHTDWNHVTSIHRGVDEVDHGQYEKQEKIDFASGCCMMVKREVFEKVGFFDERYFLYYEDADFCERVKRAGYEIYYIPGATLYHVNAASSGGAGNTLQDYFLTRNQMLFGITYAPIRAKIALIKQSSRLIFQGRPAQKKGIWDYYLGRFGKGTYFNKN